MTLISSKPDRHAQSCERSAPALQALDMAPSYSGFRHAVIALNNDDRGCFVRAAKRYGGVCRPGDANCSRASCCSAISRTSPTKSPPVMLMAT